MHLVPGRTTAALVTTGLLAGTVLVSVPLEVTQHDAHRTVAAVDLVDPAELELVALDGSEPVTVPRTTHGDLVLGTGSNAVSVALRSSGAPGSVPVREGSTAVYEDAAPSTDLAVQVTDAGAARHLLVLGDEQAPRTHAFDVDVPPGADLVLRPDGGAEVRAGARILAAVEPPWARDARGAVVPTHYTVEGGTLTQHVLADDTAAWPVVADPLWLPAGVIYVVGWRCGLSAGGAMLLYRLYSERRSLHGYFGNGTVACFTSGLGIRRY